jgi:DNA-binding response OmpR family regulator
MARILLVDDDAAVRAMLRLTLTHFGHVVIEARDGQEGLALFASSNADVLITDIVMPEKEGLAFLMELRAMDHRVKIIAISGGGRLQAASDYLHMAKQMGATRVFQKPFSNGALLGAITELLAEQPAPAAGEAPTQPTEV